MVDYYANNPQLSLTKAEKGRYKRAEAACFAWDIVESFAEHVAPVLFTILLAGLILAGLVLFVLNDGIGGSTKRTYPEKTVIEYKTEMQIGG